MDKRSLIKSIVMLISGLIGVIYIFNPTAGFIELIPDNLPIIGNLDEAAAVILVISALRYFGFDVTNIFNKKESSHSPDKIPRDIDS